MDCYVELMVPKAVEEGKHSADRLLLANDRTNRGQYQLVVKAALDRGYFGVFSREFLKGTLEEAFSAGERDYEAEVRFDVRPIWEERLHCAIGSDVQIPFVIQWDSFKRCEHPEDALRSLQFGFGKLVLARIAEAAQIVCQSSPLMRRALVKALYHIRIKSSGRNKAKMVIAVKTAYIRRDADASKYGHDNRRSVIQPHKVTELMVTGKKIHILKVTGAYELGAAGCQSVNDFVYVLATAYKPKGGTANARVVSLKYGEEYAKSEVSALSSVMFSGAGAGASASGIIRSTTNKADLFKQQPFSRVGKIAAGPRVTFGSVHHANPGNGANGSSWVADDPDQGPVVAPRSLEESVAADPHKFLSAYEASQAHLTPYEKEQSLYERGDRYRTSQRHLRDPTKVRNSRVPGGAVRDISQLDHGAIDSINRNLIPAWEEKIKSTVGTPIPVLVNWPSFITSMDPDAAIDALQEGHGVNTFARIHEALEQICSKNDKHRRKIAERVVAIKIRNAPSRGARHAIIKEGIVPRGNAHSADWDMHDHDTEDDGGSTTDGGENEWGVRKGSRRTSNKINIDGGSSDNSESGSGSTLDLRSRTRSRSRSLSLSRSRSYFSNNGQFSSSSSAENSQGYDYGSDYGDDGGFGDSDSGAGHVCSPNVDRRSRERLRSTSRDSSSPPSSSVSTSQCYEASQCYEDDGGSGARDRTASYDEDDGAHERAKSTSKKNSGGGRSDLSNNRKDRKVRTAPAEGVSRSRSPSASGSKKGTGSSPSPRRRSLRIDESRSTIHRLPVEERDLTDERNAHGDVLAVSCYFDEGAKGCIHVDEIVTALVEGLNLAKPRPMDLLKDEIIPSWERRINTDLTPHDRNIYFEVIWDTFLESDDGEDALATLVAKDGALVFGKVADSIYDIARSEYEWKRTLSERLIKIKISHAGKKPKSYMRLEAVPMKGDDLYLNYVGSFGLGELGCYQDVHFRRVLQNALNLKGKGPDLDYLRKEIENEVIPPHVADVLKATRGDAKTSPFNIIVDWPSFHEKPDEYGAAVETVYGSMGKVSIAPASEAIASLCREDDEWRAAIRAGLPLVRIRKDKTRKAEVRSLKKGEKGQHELIVQGPWHKGSSAGTPRDDIREAILNYFNFSKNKLPSLIKKLKDEVIPYWQRRTHDVYRPLVDSKVRSREVEFDVDWASLKNSSKGEEAAMTLLDRGKHKEEGGLVFGAIFDAVSHIVGNSALAAEAVNGGLLQVGIVNVQSSKDKTAETIIGEDYARNKKERRGKGRRGSGGGDGESTKEKSRKPVYVSPKWTIILANSYESGKSGTYGAEEVGKHIGAAAKFYLQKKLTNRIGAKEAARLSSAFSLKTPFRFGVLWATIDKRDKAGKGGESNAKSSSNNSSSGEGFSEWLETYRRMAGMGKDGPSSSNSSSSSSVFATLVEDAEAALAQCKSSTPGIAVSSVYVGLGGHSDGRPDETLAPDKDPNGGKRGKEPAGSAGNISPRGGGEGGGAGGSGAGYSLHLRMPFSKGGNPIKGVALAHAVIVASLPEFDKLNVDQMTLLSRSVGEARDLAQTSGGDFSYLNWLLDRSHRCWPTPKRDQRDAMESARKALGDREGNVILSWPVLKIGGDDKEKERIFFLTNKSCTLSGYNPKDKAKKCSLSEVSFIQVGECQAVGALSAGSRNEVAKDEYCFRIHIGNGHKISGDEQVKRAKNPGDNLTMRGIVPQKAGAEGKEAQRVIAYILAAYTSAKINTPMPKPSIIYRTAKFGTGLRAASYNKLGKGGIFK